MTKDNLVKLHKHFLFLSKGKFTAQDFSQEGIEEDDGRTIVGKLPAARVALIVSDAKRHLEELERKHPFLKDLKEK